MQMTHAEEDGEAYFAVSEDFKRSAERSFVMVTSDLRLRSRLMCEYSNGRDAIVASAVPLQSQPVCIRFYGPKNTVLVKCHGMDLPEKKKLALLLH